MIDANTRSQIDKFRISYNSDGFKSRFSASLKNVDAVCYYLERLLISAGLSHLKFDMILGAREILNNAVVHGSQIDVGMLVRFTAHLRNQSFIMTAADEGPGFDYQTLSADSIETDTSGRGMGILASYFDTVLYRPPGNRVELQKSLENVNNLGDIHMSEISKEGDLACIKLSCDIVSTTVEELRVEFKQILKEGFTQIKLNLAEVGYVDSLGLGLLVATHNSLQKSGNRLQLSDLSEDVSKLFKQMRLDMHFDLI